MRWKLALTVLTLAMSACTAVDTPLSPPEAAPASNSEAVNPTDTLIPEPETEALTDTPAPLADDTPLPPTIAAPIVSSPDATFLHMLNELDGWAIAENAIIRTTDGGSTWYNVSPQGVTEFGYGTANTFLSASQAWVMVTD